MRYKQNDVPVKIGDQVIVEGNVTGIVVCDFDQKKCLDGYEDWLTDDELIGGGKLSSGIMVKTDELGFLHYPEEDDDIRLVK